MLPILDPLDMGASLPPLPIALPVLAIMIYISIKVKGDKGDRTFRWKVLAFWILMISSSVVLFVVMVVYGGGTEILKSGLHCKIGKSMAVVNSDWVHWACNKGCAGQIHSKVSGPGTGAGFCDDQGACSCSENTIDLASLESQALASCDIGEVACFRSCQAIGRKGGKCTKNHKFQRLCECSDETLTKKELGLCASNLACQIHCKTVMGVDGQCQGWGCQCEVTMQNVNVVNVKQVEMVVPKQADDSTHDRPRSQLFVQAARSVNI